MTAETRALYVAAQALLAAIDNATLYVPAPSWPIERLRHAAAACRPAYLLSLRSDSDNTEPVL